MSKKLIAITIAGLLTACGGGGGSDDGNGETLGGGNGGTKATTLNINAYSTNQCGVDQPFANAEAIFHNADGGVITSQSLGTSGSAEIVWPHGAKHVSVAAIVTSADGEAAAKVFTYIDVYPAKVLPNISFTNAAAYDCGCASTDLNISELQLNYPNHSVRAISSDQARNSLLQASDNSVTICPNNNGGWQDTQIVLEPRDGNAGAAYQASFNFEPNNNYDILASAFEASGSMATEVAVTVDNPFNYVRSFTDTENGRNSFVFSFDNEPAWYFPNLAGRHFASAYISESLASLPEGDARYFSGSRALISNGNANISMKSRQAMFIAEAAQLITNAFGEGADNHYNFDNIGSGKNALNVELYNGLGEDFWFVTAPLSGEIPEIDLPVLYLSALAEIQQPNMYVSVYGYGFNGSFQSFIETAANETKKGSPRSRFFDNYSYEYLRIFGN